MTIQKLYKNWFVHNVFAHPLMQLLNMMTLVEFATQLHDSTLPNDRDTK